MRLTRPPLKPIPGLRMGAGWSLEPAPVKRRLPRDMRQPANDDPAGDPPPGFTGTRPEWAIYWAFTKLDYVPGIDFLFQEDIDALGSSFFSTLDFLVPHLQLGIEVQGVYWHIEQGVDQRLRDELRKATAAQQDITLIFIDEEDALKRPITILQDALNFEDKSMQTRGI